MDSIDDISDDEIKNKKDIPEYITRENAKSIIDIYFGYNKKEIYQDKLKYSK